MRWEGTYEDDLDKEVGADGDLGIKDGGVEGNIGDLWEHKGQEG